MKSIKRYDGINVVPFIDILLVLLAIVFVISNFIAVGKIEVVLPSSTTHESLKETKHKIAITQSSLLFIDDKEVSKNVFKAELEAFGKNDHITIISDKKALYEDFIFVVDSLKMRGLEKITMAVQK